MAVDPASTLAATATELVGRDDATAESGAAADGGSALGGALRLLLASGPGRLGIALFVAMLAISIYVLVAYPLDFGRTRWSNPTYWADNPKTAPPAWTTWLGGGGVPHTTLTETEPTETRPIPAGEIRTYRFPLSFTSDRFPTFLSLTVNGVSFSERAPSFRITLQRPDGGLVRLASLAVAAPRTGETAPYRRYYETPNRLLLTSQETAAQSLAQTYAERYPGVPVPADLADSLAAGLFARPSDDGSGRLVPLHGDYALDVQVAISDPTDTIASLKTVMGGTVFGLMGTDALGRDLIQGLMYGFPVALLIATLAAFLTTAIGAGLGILSGYAGGATDSIIQRLADIVNQVPPLPLLIFLVFVLGSHLYLIILVLVAFAWPGLTIYVRIMVLQIRSGQLVEAAKALGASRSRIMVRHVFPQVAPFIVAQMIFFAPGAILAETGLSFLGLGDPSIPTWGQILQSGFQTGALYVGYWWWVIPPGVLVVLTALAFMLLALALEPIVDPRLRKV